MSTVNNVIVEDGDWFGAHVGPGGLDQLCSTNQGLTHLKHIIMLHTLIKRDELMRA